MGNRRVKIKLLSVLLLLCLLLTGCNEWKNYIYTDASLTRVAQKALKEKYDEKFIIYDVWDACQTTFYAVCSPENDEEVVFEAEIWKDGRGIYEDEYAQGIVSKQLQERLKCFPEKIANSYWIEPIVFCRKPIQIDEVENLTVEKYIEIVEKIEEPNVYYLFFLNQDDLKGLTVEEEYSLFEKDFAEEDIIVDTCRIHFVNQETLQEVINYFKTHSDINGLFDSIVENSTKIGFGYEKKKIKIGLEEYIELRQESEKYE